jgi:hypothetical protein
MSIFIYSHRKDTKSFGILFAFGGKSAKRGETFVVPTLKYNRVGD